MKALFSKSYKKKLANRIIAERMSIETAFDYCDKRSKPMQASYLRGQKTALDKILNML